MNYDNITHKIVIFLESPSEGAREGYRRSWRHWASFCRGRNKTLWLDIQKERWVENLTNFILIEQEVLGAKPPTARRKTSGVLFLNGISGGGIAKV